MNPVRRFCKHIRFFWDQCHPIAALLMLLLYMGLALLCLMLFSGLVQLFINFPKVMGWIVGISVGVIGLLCLIAWYGKETDAERAERLRLEEEARQRAMARYAPRPRRLPAHVHPIQVNPEDVM